MRKILFILAVIVLGFSLDGFAQLNVSYESKSAPVTVAKLAKINYCELKYDQGYYIAINTDNKYDGVVIIDLGKDGPSAIKSLEYLIQIAEDKVHYASVKQGYYTISFTASRKEHVFISKEGNAGSSYISKKEFQKAIQAIKERENITD